MCLIHTDNFIDIQSGHCTATFSVFDISPMGYGVITENTRIMVKHSDSSNADCEPNDALWLAQSVQKRLDYIHLKNHGRSSVELSATVQKLVHLPEAPPLYELKLEANTGDLWLNQCEH